MDAVFQHWTSSDGQQLAWHEVGEGRPVILLHGLFSDANVNWIKFGTADLLAARGRRVIMPDLRAHGLSGRPHEADAYPSGVLGRDLAELVTHLGFAEGGYDLGGFSLGARTTVQAVGEGLKPGKAMLAGMGFEGLSGWLGRSQFFIDAIDLYGTASRGDPHWLAIQFMKTMKVDRDAARLLLPTFTDASPEWLAAFTMPTMVLCGSEDDDNGSAQALADALPDAVYETVPGTHMSSVTKPEFGQAIADFFAPN